MAAPPSGHQGVGDIVSGCRFEYMCVYVFVAVQETQEVSFLKHMCLQLPIV